MDPEAKQECRPELKLSGVPFLKSVADGSEIQVLEISRAEMLLETEARLLPQTKIQLKLVTREGLIHVNGSVQRSSMASLHDVPQYHSTITFESPFQGVDESSQASECAPLDKRGTTEPQKLYLVIVKKVCQPS